MLNTKMKVAYLTIEDVSSGLFKTQVLDILDEIYNQDNNIQFDIIIINRPWHYFKHRVSLRKYRKYFNGKSISLKYIPLLPPLRNSLRHFVPSVFVTKWLSLIFNFRLIIDNYDILHCRSYWPTIAVSNKLMPIIFDLRSLWLLENVSTGEIQPNSNSYSYWKNVEISCIKKSMFSTCVSKGMVEYVKNISPFSKVELIPISVNEDQFGFDLKKRSHNRKKLQWQNNIVFIYSGSLGQSGVNINTIMELMRKIISINESHRILIVTSEKSTHFKSLMDSFSIDIHKYKIINPNLNEISGWLDAADIGIHALPRQLDSNTRLGTKVVEYWINGLPVIVNQNVGAAVEYIKTEKIGFVLEDNVQDSNLNDTVKSLLSLKRNFIANFAKKEFSSKIISSYYLKLYREIISNKSNII